MKDKIIRMLRQKDGYVSGEDISDVLGVSRTAVWKTINTLRDEEYIIDSSSRKGYKLIESPDVLSQVEIEPYLSTKYIGRNIIYYDTLDSTNNKARDMAIEGAEEGLVVIAEEQTKGRGRLGRVWTTPKLSSAAFSIAVRPSIKPEDASGLTLIMGDAVCRAIRKVTGLNAKIKWPNDIIVNGKKVCGILTEMNAEIERINYIVLGVGININVDKFPEDIKHIATSLNLELGKLVSRKEIVAEVFNEFEMLYDDFKENGLKNIMDEFKSFSVTLGKKVRVISINEEFEGEAIDITDDGLLVVKLEDGSTRNVISGDVSVRGISGYAE